MKKKDSKQSPGIYIGTSGWVYKSWHNILYPKEIKKDFLAHYAKHYNSVEINTSFYHLPKKSTFEKWREETPPHFVAAAKLSRYITHIQGLANSKEALKRFFERANGLKEKLGMILIQLPPRLQFDAELLKRFLEDLDATRKFAGKTKKSATKTKTTAYLIPCALEPRNPSWFENNLDQVRDLLKSHDLALVFAHSSTLPYFDPDDPENIISDFVYIRFHGPREFAASQYGRRLLKPWAKRIKKWNEQGKTVFAYFNDDAHGYAVKDAKILQELVE